MPPILMLYRLAQPGGWAFRPCKNLTCPEQCRCICKMLKHKRHVSYAELALKIRTRQ